MNTKIILGLGTSVLLVTSLLAVSPDSSMQEEKSFSCKQEKMMKHHKPGDKGPDLVKMFMKLDLSPQQRNNIQAIVKESMKSVPNPHNAFSDTSFIKEEFIKLAKEKRDYKIEHRAEIIEKIYNTLTTAQKKDFKTILDMKEIIQKNHKMRKSCN